MKKTDLNKPATKGDLLALATKKELKALATKEELRKFVTREEFNYRLDAIETRMDQMITRDDWNKHMTLMDEMITEIRDSREARLLSETQWQRTSDTVHDHEKRIRVLEKAA